MSDLLSLLFTKEWLWENHSCHSSQKSDKSKSFLTKSDMSDYWFASFLRANCTFALKKRQFVQKKFTVFTLLWQFFTAFPHFMLKSELLLSLFGTGAIRSQSLFFKERREGFTHFCSLTRATVSDSLLEKSESQFRSFALLLTKSEKTSNLLKKPKSKFPTLENS